MFCLREFCNTSTTHEVDAMEKVRACSPVEKVKSHFIITSSDKNLTGFGASTTIGDGSSAMACNEFFANLRVRTLTLSFGLLSS